MKLVHTYLLAIICVLAGCTASTNWYPIYESQSKLPYGTKVFQEELEYVFPEATVDIIKERTDEFLEETTYNLTTFMYVNPRFYPNEELTEVLVNFTKQQNALFIATNEKGNPLFEKFGVQVAKKKGSNLSVTLQHLVDGERLYKVKSRFDNFSYFDTIPSYATVLGQVQIGNISYPNFIAMTIGGTDNKLFLHCNPELFSNYHMLQKGDDPYALNTLSYLDYTDYFLWDGYGTQRRYTTPPSDGDANGMLRYIMNNPSLKFSFITLCLALVLFFGFNYKRVVRNIPILRPERNNSIDFMKMVANLFMHEENHIHLAKYRSNYILDKLKGKYFMDTSTIDDEFLKNLALKTQLPEAELKPFFLQIKRAKTSNYLNKKQFTRFSEIVESNINKLKIHT